MSRSELQHFRVRSEMHVIAQHSAPRHVGAASDASREVLEDVRWLKVVMKPWGGREDGLLAVAGRTASSSSRGFVVGYLQGTRQRSTVFLGVFRLQCRNLEGQKAQQLRTILTARNSFVDMSSVIMKHFEKK